MKVKAGFTLIELSIVLVIIGLISGGVLVGRDLIHAAQLRAQVTQIEKYNSAVNTFRGKYGYIPGDIPYYIANQYGFFTFDNTCGSGAGSSGCGNGNGLLDLSVPAAKLGATEELAFWRHLTDSQLIDGAFGTIGNSALTPSGAVTNTVTDVSQSLPRAKIGSGYVIAYAALNNAGTAGGAGSNFFQIMTVGSISTAPEYFTGTVAGMTPLDAHNIDAKIDDGMPNTGRVTAMLPGRDQWPALWFANPIAGFCLTGGATDGTDPNAIYSVVSDAGVTESCSIRIRFN